MTGAAGRSETTSFIGAGGHRLAARLEHPDGATRAFALFAHCFTCSKDIAAAREISRSLRDAGIAVLRFDFTGLGESGGSFAESGLSGNVDDLVSAGDHLRREHRAPALIVGHSLGGAAAILAAARIDEIRAVVTIGAPADAAHAIHHFGAAEAEILAKGRAEVSIGGRPFTVGRRLIEDLREARVIEAASRLRKPLLIMHAPRDETVGIENATRLFAAAKHPKSFISLDDADHLLSRAADARYAAGVIAAWAARYLPAAA